MGRVVEALTLVVVVGMRLECDRPSGYFYRELKREKQVFGFVGDVHGPRRPSRPELAVKIAAHRTGGAPLRRGLHLDLEILCHQCRLYFTFAGIWLAEGDLPQPTIADQGN
jgi:hypothetical protein